MEELFKTELDSKLDTEGTPTPTNHTVMGEGDIVVVRLANDTNVRLPEGTMLYIPNGQVDSLTDLMKLMSRANANKMP